MGAGARPRRWPRDRPAPGPPPPPPRRPPARDPAGAARGRRPGHGPRGRARRHPRLPRRLVGHRPHHPRRAARRPLAPAVRDRRHPLEPADPAVQTAFRRGGVFFFTHAMLGGLAFTFTLVLLARLAGRRSAPLVLTLGVVLVQASIFGVGDLGFALLPPGPAPEAAL